MDFSAFLKALLRFCEHILHTEGTSLFTHKTCILHAVT